MAVSEEFNFVVCAWASESYHNGVADALEVKLDSAVLQSRDKLKQLFETVHPAPTLVDAKYINAVM
jgi:hypothetical protein